MRRHAQSIGYVAAAIAALAMFAPALAATTAFKCQFGDSSGVGLRDGKWERGSKSGATTILYRRDGRSALGTRQIDLEEPLSAILVIDSRSLQFIVTQGPAPASMLEITTIDAVDETLFAVRSVHVAGGFGGPSSITDVGTCERLP
jgi:hypothetical protein